MYTTYEASRLIGVSERQVRTLLKQGKLEGQKIGRDWVIFNLNYKRKRKPRLKQVKD
ncbi:MAG: helix-turn-helix domain-containing protein [Dehalococcoidia bacterium]|nr:helix-turn-helix domain-containing protein [Dehalococcoidia bacterium]